GADWIGVRLYRLCASDGSMSNPPDQVRYPPWWGCNAASGEQRTDPASLQLGSGADREHLCRGGRLQDVTRRELVRLWVRRGPHALGGLVHVVCRGPELDARPQEKPCGT